MNETPFFFDGEQGQLFGVIHEPENSVRPFAWILCHAFAEEKLWAHRVMVNTARELAAVGFPVLRFDYRGYGDSDGRFEDSAVDGQLQDINDAIVELHKRHPSIKEVGLIGLRYGATLAALAATRQSQVKRLVLWDPVLDMASYLQDVLRANLTTQMVMHGKIVTNRDELTAQIMAGDLINIDGYDLSKHFFEPASKINLLENPLDYDGDCLVVQIGRANQPLKKDLQKLVDGLPSAKLQKVVEEPFWKEIKNYIPRSEGLSSCLFEWLGDAQ